MQALSPWKFVAAQIDFVECQAALGFPGADYAGHGRGGEGWVEWVGGEKL